MGKYADIVQQVEAEEALQQKAGREFISAVSAGARAHTQRSRDQAMNALGAVPSVADVDAAVPKVPWYFAPLAGLQRGMKGASAAKGTSVPFIPSGKAEPLTPELMKKIEATVKAVEPKIVPGKALTPRTEGTPLLTQKAAGIIRAANLYLNVAGAAVQGVSAFLEAKEELGREPSFEEVVRHMTTGSAYPPDMI